MVEGVAMTTLEQLVPPFELCRKIPADSFNGTALVWKTYHRGIISDNPYVAERDTWDHEFREDAEQPIIPAPTVQEILEAMPESKTTEAGVQRRHGGYYCYMCKISADIDIGELNCKSGNNLPEALLKLWLDVIRVEREAKNAKHEAT
jgi:hypothetical protein